MLFWDCRGKEELHWKRSDGEDQEEIGKWCGGHAVSRKSWKRSSGGMRKAVGCAYLTTQAEMSDKSVEGRRKNWDGWRPAVLV